MALTAALCMVGGPFLLFSALRAALDADPTGFLTGSAVIPVAIVGGALPLVGLVLARHGQAGRAGAGLLLALLVVSIVLFLLASLTPGWIPRFPAQEWSAVRDLVAEEFQRLR
ncbi:hypothetical protein J4H86_12705 [Spiractinospora alimapuensis]|uniref:hypothetical protein n=1 Tax=Spiractinospora alimapuensis TaxID=2820884 RepID=UPI001F354129|nr:hypothetical protein [Spiractinospora alimapuensis]QVQ54449.1 hypothetical protein J4H86_12705 [Spiractinospora alimapuensis]